MSAAVALAIAASACMQQRAGESVRAAAAAVDQKCTSDGECASGFCDRNVCRAPSGILGRPCEPAPRTKDGLRDAMLNVCGAYLCVEGRCRSCVSDGECRAELGSPRCYESKGDPGRRCGNPPS
jgi:hypothetical protein